MEDAQDSLILALPKGRVFEDIIPMLKGSELELFDDPNKTRKLLLDTKNSKFKIILNLNFKINIFIDYFLNFLVIQTLTVAL